ncbi:hypothetical protein B0H13DRAFT_2302387 [Mycena leptocephala]|nr:hypothetical protein B0H13DRAFT_2302387 [Mycena leptocephala]
MEDVDAYGPLFMSILPTALLYGIALLQTYLYFCCHTEGRDTGGIRTRILLVGTLETVQICASFASIYVRFVQYFGRVQKDLIWSDPVQLIANYLSAFTVQTQFASQIRVLMTQPHTIVPRFLMVSTYTIFVFAFAQIGAGIAITILSCESSSEHYLRPLIICQTSSALGCDILIVGSLCIWLQKNAVTQSEGTQIESVTTRLTIFIVNRGMLTALSSGATLILFLKYSNWFLLTFCPMSKLYANGMLAK